MLVALDESSLADFRAWMQLVTEEHGDDVSCAVITMLTKDKTKTHCRYFRCDAGDLTYLAAVTADIAAERRAES